MVQLLKACFSVFIIKTCMGNHLRESSIEKRQLTEFPSLSDIIHTDPDLTVLSKAFKTVELVGVKLCTTCNLTAFAPTDCAFGELNQSFLENLFTPNWSSHLNNLLSFHITLPTVDRVTTKNFTDGQVLDMLNLEEITVSRQKSGISLSSYQTNVSNIVEADILASNGALSKVDSVLLPNFFGTNVFALGDKYVDFTILQELFEQAGYTGREGSYTILAPDNDAFQSATDEPLEELRNNTVEIGFILANHVIPGVYPSDTLTDGQKLLTLGGQNVTVSITRDISSNEFRAAQESGTIIKFNGVPAAPLELLAVNGIAYRFGSLVFDPDPTSSAPSDVPSDSPSASPTNIPTTRPSQTITEAPTGTSLVETVAPTTMVPTSLVPTTLVPTTLVPTSDPTTIFPTMNPSSTAVPVIDSFCIDFNCGDGYVLVENPENTIGNDRETCCVQDGTCTGVPSGSVCFIGDVDSSIIPNPSFEVTESCPDNLSELYLAVPWVQATAATTDYFVGSPVCDESWFRNGFLDIGPIPQSAKDGVAFVGTINAPVGDYYEYLGACLNSPLKAGVEYTLNLDVAAGSNSNGVGERFGGDTNGFTDILCIPNCTTFDQLYSLGVFGYQGNSFEILASAAPGGGLIGGGDWKTIQFNFVPSIDCPAIMIGAGASHSVQEGQDGSYVLYDSLNLQERIAGVCNDVGECIQASTPTVAPASNDSSCIDFDCGDGFVQIENPENIIGNDRETCCVRDGICNGVPSGSVCFTNGFDIIRNPSFEIKKKCPIRFGKLDLAEVWVTGTWASADYFVRSPSCNDTWISEDFARLTEYATDGDAFIGAAYYKDDNIYQYFGACLSTGPLRAGIEYTLNMDVAAVISSNDENDLTGGDTNGITEVLCIPDCDTFSNLKAKETEGYLGNEFEILASSAPTGGLIGGGGWKTMTFNFKPSVDCPAIMIGAGESHSVEDGQEGSYVLYDSIYLQERIAGVCDDFGECIQSPRPTVAPSVSSAPTSSFFPSPSASECYIDDDSVCDDGDLCTNDVCDSCDVKDEYCCFYTRKSCGDDEKCDPVDGVCKNEISRVDTSSDNPSVAPTLTPVTTFGTLFHTSKSNIPTTTENTPQDVPSVVPLVASLETSAYDVSNSTSFPTHIPSLSTPPVPHSLAPTNQPNIDETKDPMFEPTTFPISSQTEKPIVNETSVPNATPTGHPTTKPIADPTAAPTIDPTVAPVADPTVAPTVDPTLEPTTSPTKEPTEEQMSEPVK